LAALNTKATPPETAAVMQPATAPFIVHGEVIFVVRLVSECELQRQLVQWKEHVDENEPLRGGTSSGAEASSRSLQIRLFSGGALRTKKESVGCARTSGT
jgi:hypothetical protein